MKFNKYILPAFAILVFVQLYIPLKMVLDSEKVLKGQELKFKTAPIDPTDPFRGKYIVLSFEENEAIVPAFQKWRKGELAYLGFTSDTDGFAIIDTVYSFKPSSTTDFLEVPVTRVLRVPNNDNKQKIRFNYPFNRYYMEESKAYAAEVFYRNSIRDSTKVTYAVVSINNGKAILSDVMCNGVSLKDLVDVN